MSGTPEGYDALALAANVAGLHLHIARDATRMAALADAIAFFAPDLPVTAFPAWDCLPYDRVSPNREVAAQRIAALASLAERRAPVADRLVVITSVNAVLQRVPARETLEGALLDLGRGAPVDLEELRAFLSRNGFERVGTVREPGEYAVRGGIVDLFPPGAETPLRLDLFGDEVEDIRAFDPTSQRTIDARVERCVLRPAGEVTLNDQSIARFRAGYRESFGDVAEDPFYGAISEGRGQIGMEHWLPLFHDRLETIFDYMPGASVTLDHEADAACDGRLELIAEYYDARMTYLNSPESRRIAAPYRPLPPDRLYLRTNEFAAMLDGRAVGQFSPFAAPDGGGGARWIPDFAAAKVSEEQGVFDILRNYIANDRSRRIVVTGFSQGSRERLGHLLRGHGIAGLANVDDWKQAQDLPPGAVALAVLPVERGFRADGISLITEQDILGERIVRPERRRKRAENFISDVSEIAPGDLVVHIDHGVGRYDGLETLDVASAPHDCLGVFYANGDKLYVPVENVEVLSRYGSGDMRVSLDRLGSAGWQARKARLKNRLRDIADQLMRLAAERALRPALEIAAPPDPYEEFAAGFPYAETEDQAEAISLTLKDLESGRAMDRLICGDVGFGKTEVALRAAFATVMSGAQVAVVAPTTLLCRQHFGTFSERFARTPVRVEQLSRMVTGKAAEEVRQGASDGRIDIVIGTHALLGKAVRFADLGLLVVDEEQHFGVRHKERLKELKTDVHVLTLTATPIPRTLQMALTGVKDMSLIATPPVDRLAVRTFVMPHDPVMIREAIMREHFRGGQVFYVCPRIADLDDVAASLRNLVPEIRMRTVHGRMKSQALEEAMSAFYDGEADLLLSTQIVESGLDIPRANTMVVHRADMFGLAQLYQLRGRIGRSKLRAYCYLTLPPPGRKLTEGARKRLEVMQALDTLGAGFTLASHDLDIRGAGNLLGEEQSGHIREVGVELYQHMLEEAVASARGGGEAKENEWSPAINLGVSVLIPDRYVSDLDVRLGLYRRIAQLDSGQDSEAFAAELIDRFGALPDEVENLLRIVAIKRDCRRAGIERLDAGPKGATLAFRNGTFGNAEGLIAFLSKDRDGFRLRPDGRLVRRADWRKTEARLRGAGRLARKLADIAAGSGSET